MNAPILATLEGLPKARQSGGKFMACCPVHDDRNPSLSWTEGDDGKVLIHCFAGCSPEDVVAAVGMTLGDLFRPTNGHYGAYEPMSRDRHGDWAFQSDRDADQIRSVATT